MELIGALIFAFIALNIVIPLVFACIALPRDMAERRHQDEIRKTRDVHADLRLKG